MLQQLERYNDIARVFSNPNILYFEPKTKRDDPSSIYYDVIYHENGIFRRFYLYNPTNKLNIFILDKNNHCKSIIIGNRNRFKMLLKAEYGYVERHPNEINWLLKRVQDGDQIISIFGVGRILSSDIITNIISNPKIAIGHNPNTISSKAFDYITTTSLVTWEDIKLNDNDRKQKFINDNLVDVKKFMIFHVDNYLEDIDVGITIDDITLNGLIISNSNNLVMNFQVKD